MSGRRPFALADERDWALVAELAERGFKARLYAVWHFLDNDGISFKK